jgi:hypothetical protein
VAALSVAGYYGFDRHTTAEGLNALIIDDTYIYPRNAEVRRFSVEALWPSEITNSSYLE